jgi:predicted PurR-regulated permease PerM
MQDFLKNKKYVQIFLCAVLTVICGILFYFVMTDSSRLSEWIDKLISVLSPLIYGCVIAYIMLPFMRFCERKLLRFKEDSAFGKKIKRPLAVMLTMLLFLLIVTVIVVLIIPQVGNSFVELESQINNYVSAAQNLADKIIRDFPLFNGQYENLSEFLDVNELTTDIKGFISGFYGYLEQGAKYLISYAGSFVIEVKNALIGFIVAIYLLSSKERLAAKTKKILSAVLNRRHYVNLINLVRFTDKTFGGFVIGKIIDSIIIGVLTFIVMSIIGMPFTPLISVIVGITNVIPFFGPFIGAIPSAFIMFIAEPKMTVWFVLMIFIIQQLDGNVIGPKILGSSTGLTSLAVLIAIMIGGGFFGVAGMILGVPAAAVICALVKQKTDEKLLKKNAPVSLDYYYDDPPRRDFDTEPIFLPKEDASEHMSAVQTVTVDAQADNEMTTDKKFK